MDRAAPPFNLLVSTGRGLEERCIDTLREIMGDVDEGFSAHPARFSGLVTAAATIPSRDAVRHIAEVVEREPWHNLIVKRVVPVDLVVLTDEARIVDGFRELLKMRPPHPSESFRVTLRRRGARLDRDRLIRSVADLFDNRVDLERPDLEARIEVLGGETGLSILRRGEIFPEF